MWICNQSAFTLANGECYGVLWKEYDVQLFESLVPAGKVWSGMEEVNVSLDQEIRKSPIKIDYILEYIYQSYALYTCIIQ